MPKMNITRAGLCVSQLTSIAGSDWVNLPETVPRSRPVSGPYRDLDVECETHIGGPWNDWVRLKYEMTEYWTGEPLAIDDKIFLATSRPPFGALRHLVDALARCSFTAEGIVLPSSAVAGTKPDELSGIPTTLRELLVPANHWNRVTTRRTKSDPASEPRLH